MTREERTQSAIDRFYRAHGPCCAGCDHWKWHNSVAGDCTKNPPVGAHERWSMLFPQGTSAPIPSGQVVTPREHLCGAFVDTFDWGAA